MCINIVNVFLCIEQTILGMFCDLAFFFAMAGVTYVADKWPSLGVHGIQSVHGYDMWCVVCMGSVHG